VADRGLLRFIRPFNSVKGPIRHFKRGLFNSLPRGSRQFSRIGDHQSGDNPFSGRLTKSSLWSDGFHEPDVQPAFLVDTQSFQKMKEILKLFKRT
jgi:hypothetical protein